MQEKAKLTALQAATKYLQALIARSHSGADIEEQPTVYAVAFRTLLNECGITNDEWEARIIAYLSRFSVEERETVQRNIRQEAAQANMSQKTFVKLVQIFFPAA